MQDFLSDISFSKIVKLIKEVAGINISYNKKVMLEGRLRKRIKALSLDGFDSYCTHLFSPKGQDQELIYFLDVITTNKTDFFRENEHFELLVRKIIPEILKSRSYDNSGNLNIWSAGSSTGKEAYTIAMVLANFFNRQPEFSFRFKILGTDLSTGVLKIAKKAIYRKEDLEQIPVEYQKKYIMVSKKKNEGLIRIVPEIRNLTQFRRLNFADRDFKMREKMDIVFFRNVMIYFDREMQYQTLLKITGNIRKGGFLFMGHSETLNGFDLPLKFVAPTVYRKI